MIKKNYYLILEIPRDEDQAGIREAFRRMAKRYHPDLAGPEWSHKFQDVHEAYEVLSHPEKRKKYNDELRRQEEKESARAGPVFVGRTGPPPEPLISQPINFRDFFTSANPIEALFERFCRNFS